MQVLAFREGKLVVCSCFLCFVSYFVIWYRLMWSLRDCLCGGVGGEFESQS